MNLALVSGINALVNVTKLCNGGLLQLYSGTQPTNPESALSGNTLLAAFTFSNPAFLPASLSGGNEQQVASFSPSSVAPSANGTVTFARATMSTSAWAISTGYSCGRIVTANSNLYICVGSGTANNGTSLGSGTGPSAAGNSPSIQDSTLYWQYLGGATATVIADFTVGTSGTDIIIGNNVLSTTINVTITSFILQIPAV